MNLASKKSPPHTHTQWVHTHLWATAGPPAAARRRGGQGAGRARLRVPLAASCAKQRLSASPARRRRGGERRGAGRTAWGQGPSGLS